MKPQKNLGPLYTCRPTCALRWIFLIEWLEYISLDSVQKHIHHQHMLELPNLESKWITDMKDISSAFHLKNVKYYFYFSFTEHTSKQKPS